MSASIVQFPNPTCVCGEQGLRRELNFKGEPVCTIIMCDDCFDRKDELLNTVRPVFKTMLECGIDNAVANDVMTYLLERIEP